MVYILFAAGPSEMIDIGTSKVPCLQYMNHFTYSDQSPNECTKFSLKYKCVSQKEHLIFPRLKKELASLI